MSRFGPTRGEFRAWLAVGLFILGLLAVAALVRGVPRGMMAVEVFGFGGLFGLGLVIWAARGLWRSRGGDG